MAKSSNEEILQYLEASDKLSDTSWDLIKDKWFNSRYEFIVEERDEIPEE